MQDVSRIEARPVNMIHEVMVATLVVHQGPTVGLADLQALPASVRLDPGKVANPLPHRQTSAKR
jgi:hypothetical protein